MKWVIVCLLFGIGCVLLASGCSSHPIHEETPDVLPEPPAQTAQNTVAPTWTETPSATVLTVTALPTNTPSVTSIPTMSGEQAKAHIFEQIEDNGGCRLPCLWGLEPGDERERIEQYFQQFPDIIQDGYNIGPYIREFSGHLLFQFDIEYGKVGLSLSYDYDNPNAKILQFRAGLPNRSDGYINIFGHSSLDRLIEHYSLSQILSNYGQPEQIFFQAWELEPVAPLTREEYLIALYYPEQGFLIQYNGHAVQNTGTHLVICPREMSVDVVTWDPRQNPTLEEVAKSGNSFTLNPVNLQYTTYRIIEEASSLTVEEFYEIYRNPDHTDCFETPKEYWRR